MNCIGDGIWIASIDEAAEETTERFDTVISVCQDTASENISDGADYHHFPLADSHDSESRWGGSYEYELFEQAADMLRTRDDSETVLIHCHHGIDRSVSVATAVYAIEHDMAFEAALPWVRGLHERADPSENMREFAERYVDKHRT